MRLDVEGAAILRPYKENSLRPTSQAVAFAAPTRASTMERKITRPSAEPSADSTARSGWGMRPATFRSRLQTPAIFLTAPLGLPALSASCAGANRLSEPSRVL